MDVLLLGNGFDISFGLPTRYVDFIKVVDYLVKQEKQIPQTVKSVLDEVGLNGDYAADTSLEVETVQKIIQLAKANIWLRYFTDKLNHEGDTWIDFEQQMSFINKLFQETMAFIDGRIDVSMTDARKQSSRELLYLVNEFFDPFFVEDSHRIGSSWQAKYRPEFLTEYPPKSGVHILDKAKVTQKLQTSLVDLAEMLKLYLKYFVDKPVKEHAETIRTHNKIQYQRVNHILTFNYTNTYEALYPSNQTMVRHLHGNVETDIVLGYNPDEADFQEPANTDLLTFKKYYQRAYYNTTQELIRFNNIIRTNRNQDIELFVMGFSLSSNDEDIIRMLFTPATKITIYCHSESAKAEYIRNLVQIYSKLGFDELVYHKQLQFITDQNSLEAYFNRQRIDDFF